jgi:hypothetical protein
MTERENKLKLERLFKGKYCDDIFLATTRWDYPKMTSAEMETRRSELKGNGWRQVHRLDNTIHSAQHLLEAVMREFVETHKAPELREHGGRVEGGKRRGLSSWIERVLGSFFGSL